MSNNHNNSTSAITGVIGFLAGAAITYFWTKRNFENNTNLLTTTTTTSNKIDLKVEEEQKHQLQHKPAPVISQRHQDENPDGEKYSIDTKNELFRLKKRGSYDKQAIYAILDESIICHVSFIRTEESETFPVVLPMLYGRRNDEIYLHGHANNKMLQCIQEGIPVCIEVTILDGLVYARSLFHSSANYRSVTMFGHAQLISDNKEKMDALQIVADHAMPERWNDSRIPNDTELNSTRVIKFTIDNAVAKIRKGGPIDEKADLSLDFWAGVLPIHLTKFRAEPDCDPTIPLPAYISRHPKLA
jgi:nitroimidazol reductase NimA-like FMN-containing flavoprotein (pyridoxamine 5'-phosphate oxidase superfamily)